MRSARYLAAGLLAITAFGQRGSSGWHVSLTNCKRNSKEFACYLVIRNETSKPNAFYFNWTKNSTPITSATGNDGKTYYVQRVYPHGHLQSVTGDGSAPSAFIVEPNATIFLNFFFFGPIPPALTELTALDISFGKASLEGRPSAAIPGHFQNIPLLPEPDEAPTPWWKTPLASTFFLYGYVVFSLGVFLRHAREPNFMKSVILYCALATVAACLIQYGGAFSMRWDYSRWHWGDEFGLFPLRISNDGPHEEAIPKLSVTYWVLTAALSVLFITFPQAVLNASGLYLAHKRGLIAILRRLANLCGIGLGFFAVILTVTSLFAPFPSTNWFLMLIGCAVAVIMVGADIKADLKKGWDLWWRP